MLMTLSASFCALFQNADLAGKLKKQFLDILFEIIWRDILQIAFVIH